MRLLFLLAILPQEENPYEIEKKMRQKIAAAETIHVVLEMEPIKGRIEISIKGKDRFRIHIKGRHYHGRESVDLTTVNDGRRIVQIGRSPRGFDPKEFLSRFRSPSIARLFYLFSHSTSLADMDDFLKLTKKEKVGGRNSYRIEYILVLGETSFSSSLRGTIWIDTETFLPLEMTFERGRSTPLVKFTKFELDGRIDDSTFSTQSMSAVNRGVMKLLLRSIETYQTYNGAPPPSLEALVKRPGEDIFWPDGGYMLRSVPKKLVMDAARLKAGHPISHADAFALATAVREHAALVTGDPDLKRFVDADFVEIDWIGS